MRLPARRTVLYSVLGAFGLGLLGLGTAYALVDVPSPKASATREASVLQYADGSELARVGALDRDLVPLSAVSKDVQHAVLAAEQRSYYSDGAVSPKAVLRAVFANVRGGGVRQGGSTITQQYVKNAYLSDERTFSRKAKEALVAVKLARSRSKAQVLEGYLNTVYFGRGAYGVQVAAKTWFGKDAKDLDGAEGAVLAALLKSPSGFDPAKDPEDAKARWRYVLDGMVEQGWLTREDRAKAVYPTVRKAAKSAADDRSGPRGYVVDLVEAELSRIGFPEGSLQRGGLVVRTTLRKKAQAAAVEAVQDVVPDADPDDQHAVQGALVAVRPGTGEVVAYYGGRAGDGGFDYASQGRQDAGSTMKPYVLAAALDRGISLKTRLPGDSPLTVPGYSKPVSNFGDEDFGEVDVVDATAESINTAYVTLAAKTGPGAVAATAHALGIREADRLSEPDGPPSLAIALGVYGVRVVDQAAAFATLADRGTYAAPFVVQTVKAAGGTQVYRAERRTRRALPEDVTSDVTSALQQVVQRGTARRHQVGRPAIGKTGTTQDSRDAWMVGAVPQLSAAVWIGRGDNEPMPGVTGGGRPATIWEAFLRKAVEGEPVRAFPPAAGVGTEPSPSPTPSPTASPSPDSSPSPSPAPSLPDVGLPTGLPTQDGPSQDGPPQDVPPPDPQPTEEPFSPAPAEPSPSTDTLGGTDGSTADGTSQAYGDPVADPYAVPSPPRGSG